MGEIAEKDRVESTRSVLVRYGEIENQVSKSRSDETSSLALFVECIKKEVDLGTYGTEFNVSWPEPAKTGYENYRIREPVMSKRPPSEFQRKNGLDTVKNRFDLRPPIGPSHEKVP